MMDIRGTKFNLYFSMRIIEGRNLRKTAPDLVNRAESRRGERGVDGQKGDREILLNAGKTPQMKTI